MADVKEIKKIFSLKGSEWELEVLSDALNWTPCKAGHTAERKAVHISETQLLHCELSQTDGTDNNSTLSIGYINKQPHDKWTYEQLTFAGNMQADDVISWQEALGRVLRSGKAKRPQKLLVLINPNAGKGNAVTLFDTMAAPLFSAAGIDTDVLQTKSSEHIDEIISTYDFRNIDGIICSGGDGTISLICNAYYQRFAQENDIDISTTDCELRTAPIPIGILPTGSSQFLAQRALHGSRDLETAVLRIVAGETFAQAAASVHAPGGTGLVGLALIGVGVGLSAEFAKLADDMRYLGRFRYTVAALRNLWSWRTTDLEYQYKNHDTGLDWSAPEAITSRTCGLAVFAAAADPDTQGEAREWLPCIRAVFADTTFARRSVFSKPGALMGNLEQLRVTPGLRYVDAHELKVRYTAGGGQGEYVTVDGEVRTPGAALMHLRYHPHVFTMFGDCARLHPVPT